MRIVYLCANVLQGKRVLITPNVKPGKEIISSLVKAVHGQVYNFCFI